MMGSVAGAGGMGGSGQTRRGNGVTGGTSGTPGLTTACGANPNVASHNPNCPG